MNLKNPLITLLLCTCIPLGLGAPRLSLGADKAAPYWRSLPPVTQGQNLQDCAQKLDAKKGGWCEIRSKGAEPSIAAVWPKNLEKRTRMIMGPRSVLTAWNSGAIDQKRKRMYFHGGGHADYGGNEVYEFDLMTGKWSRLTDPSPLDHLYVAILAKGNRPARYCWVQDTRKVPSSSHTYDGFEFNPRTETIVLLAFGAANGACFDDKTGKFANDSRVRTDFRGSGGVYEFNPSRSETRNGLAPLSWRRVLDWKYPRPLLEPLPDGNMLAGTQTVRWYLTVADGRFKLGGKQSSNPDAGDGTATYDPTRNLLWTVFRNYLMGFAMNGSKVMQFRRGPINGKALQVDKRGNLVTWSGSSVIGILNPDEKKPQWRSLEWGGHGPEVGDFKVYGKWRYLPDFDLFVGISRHNTGMWIYRHPTDAKMTVWSTLNPQKLVNDAAEGSVVVIPPGVYGSGLLVRKSLTLKLLGADLRDVAARKGVINVNCDGCKVVIEDFVVDGRWSDCLRGNCAGIKAEGINFDLTVRRAHISNTVMGILTDNRGGSLLIEDSLVENTNRSRRSRTLGHGVYAGNIDSLVLRNSSIRSPFGRGHILKSRAPRTLVENSRLLGLEGRHSRSIDFPCGGELVVKNSAIHHGDQTDNNDVIGVALELKNCRDWGRPSKVTISDTKIVIDRDGSPDEPAFNYGPTVLLHWKGEVVGANVVGNEIVNPEGSPFLWNYGAELVPDQSAKNHFATTTDRNW